MMNEQMEMGFEEGKKLQEIPDIQISYKKTGDPFVDAGGMALQYITEKFPEKNIMQLIEWAAKVYVEKWGGKLNSVFHGSPITHPTTPNNQRIPKTIEAFNKLTKELNEGYCRYCGQKAFLTEAGREKSCLVGSGAFVNFHHAHEEGLMICPSCVTKYFFLPFALIQMGNLSLLHTVTNHGEEYWKRKTIFQNLDKISRNTSDSMLKSEIKNPSNAIFSFASELINEFENEFLNENLTLYHFTNFAASVDCSIFLIPNPVFKFLSQTLKSVPRQWYKFVYQHYHISGAKWDDATNTWQKKGNQVTEDEYQNNKNNVYNALLEGNSILRSMTRYYQNQINRDIGLDSRMAIYYAKEVLQMTTEQIAMIRKIGSKIFDLMEKGDSFKKYMVKLESTSKAHQFRSALLTIIKRNYTEGNEDPIVTLEEWVNYLFPDGSYWGEVRDLLLIFLYEKMHESKIDIDLSDDEVEETTEQEENKGA
ncbi:MAG: type I-B CRISPR-associated protein Cas8b1/Cst1 [Candidatus Atribacteria bacterium]|nr:type I-B CRISPR-associated protein Cas8b1/Cst1 [Candidatus Atribacteria bacterium]